MLPGFADSSIHGWEVRGDVESPRRRLDSVCKKSEDAELVLECEAPVGVIGGVSAPLSCMLLGYCEPMVEDQILVGEPGGVDSVLTGDGLECLLDPGTASLYPSLVSVVCS